MIIAKQFCGAVLLAAAASFAGPPAGANDIITEWSSVKLPPPPQLKPVTVDPKTTALLVLDLMKANCGARPRCVPIVPNVKKLIDAARAHGMMVVYNLTGASKPEDMVDPSIQPKPGDFMIQERSRRRQVHPLQPRQGPEGKGHQDRHHHRHLGAGRGRHHQQWRHRPRLQGDRAGRRDRLGGRLPRALRHLSARRRRPRRVDRQRHRDAQRHDQIRGMTFRGRSRRSD